MPQRLALIIFCMGVVCLASGQNPQGKAEAPVGSAPLNVLLLTLDDMGVGTTGAEGCRVPNITPNIDKLAAQGILFRYGYVMVPMCGPSRAALLTGRYPHKSGMMGHGKQPPEKWVAPPEKTPALSTYLHERGYRTGAILKYQRTAFLNTWDVTYAEKPYGVGFEDRNADVFYERTLSFISEAKEMGKPFLLYANPIDPHDPWPDTEQEKQLLDEFNPTNPYPKPGRKYAIEEVDVPACLADLPHVRENLAPYFESLHRGDACIGSILKALEDSGQAERTLVVFMSDNGMCVPGAKNTLYPHGTRTPIIMKWPGVIQPGRVDDRSIVSAIDIMPTILEALKLPAVDGIEGRSIFDVITGKREITQRKHALTTFDYWGNSTREQYYPQRSVINKEFCYIWNAYSQLSGGQKVVPMPWNEVLLGGDAGNAKVAQRLAQHKQRPVEEFYDLSKDPGCWNNLISDPAYKEELERYRGILKQEMTESGDPLTAQFDASK